MVSKKIIAFDFDGVLCDGLAEYFYSSAIAHQAITNLPLESSTLENIRPAFYELRLVIETGWEMVALIQALLNGETVTAIWQDWSDVLQKTLQTWDVDQQQLMVALDETRDRLITSELDHWLSLHRFYPGVIEDLQRLQSAPDIDVYIITTKEGRFAHQLLLQQGIDFAREKIFGKEVKQPKAETLKQLLHPDIASIWFIEDRFKTLAKVQQEKVLDHIKLFFATWGYNRPADLKKIATNYSSITAVDLGSWHNTIEQFLGTE